MGCREAVLMVRFCCASLDELGGGVRRMLVDGGLYIARMFSGVVGWAGGGEAVGALWDVNNSKMLTAVVAGGFI